MFDEFVKNHISPPLAGGDKGERELLDFLRNHHVCIFENDGSTIQFDPKKMFCVGFVPPTMGGEFLDFLRDHLARYQEIGLLLHGF